MNWKLPSQLRWAAAVLRQISDGEAIADICEEAAKELETDRQIIMGQPIEIPIEEGDRENGFG